MAHETRQRVGETIRNIGDAMIAVAPEHEQRWNPYRNSDMTGAIEATGRLLQRIGNRIMPPLEIDKYQG